MKIAQLFSAGSGVNQLTKAAKRATEFPLRTVNFKLLSSVSRTHDRFHADPSAEALGYFRTVRYCGRLPSPF